MPSEQRLTVLEAAQRLRVTRATLYQWIAEGKVPAVRIGSRTIRVRESDLERAEHLVTPTAA